MKAMLELARQENAAMHQKWQTGGSILYPAELPYRPRPKSEQKKASHIPEDSLIGATSFDEALEHVNWCRIQGMGPQDVCASINAPLSDTWGGAVAILERYIKKQRGQE